MVFNGKKDIFFSNKVNKHRFIALLRDHLEQRGCCTDQARGDADLLIAKSAIAEAEIKPTPVCLVGDDTDLLVLLCYHTKDTTTNLYFRPEPKQVGKHLPQCWNIAILKRAMGPQVCKSILFTHAFHGCDGLCMAWEKDHQ
jgi:hypothetical protein